MLPLLQSMRTSPDHHDLSNMISWQQKTQHSASMVCDSDLFGASHLFPDLPADLVPLQYLLRPAPNIAVCCSHCLWQNHSCLLSLASRRAWLGSLCKSKYRTNTAQHRHWGRGGGLQGPSLLCPMAHVSWCKISACVGGAPWVPPAMQQWSY